MKKGKLVKLVTFHLALILGQNALISYIADSVGGCYCIHGFCFFLSSFGSPEGDSDFEIPGENRCSDYTDCECR